MAGARALWRATGMKEGDFDKPIIAVVNSFTQFVPGHVHLKDLGQMVAREIEAAGGIAKEFNTIALCDGIAMGHGGMLYSLPSRELIADSVEYMINAHNVDAMVCISNCDKITPGMLMASLRLNIPVVFVSGGPMEAGKMIDIMHGKAESAESDGGKKTIKIDLIDAMIQAGNPDVSDEDVMTYERSSCPTCGSCSGMFTANSMNCLMEVLGLALPGNGTLLATHADRKELFLTAGRKVVELARRYYEQDDASVLPRSIVTKPAFENAMALDVAMGGSTNTVLHLLRRRRAENIAEAGRGRTTAARLHLFSHGADLLLNAFVPLWLVFSCSAIWPGMPHRAELPSMYLIILTSAWLKLLNSLQASSGCALRLLASWINLPRRSASSRSGTNSFMQLSPGPPAPAWGGGAAKPPPPPPKAAGPALGNALAGAAAGAAALPLMGGNGDALV